MNKLHIRCRGACGCGSGYFSNFKQAKDAHESDMWAYEMPHDYSPEQIDDATGKRTPLDKNTGKPLTENTMKKSELRTLIKEVISEIYTDPTDPLAQKFFLGAYNHIKKTGKRRLTTDS